jgi:hypothetical protein
MIAKEEIVKAIIRGNAERKTEGVPARTRMMIRLEEPISLSPATRKRTSTSGLATNRPTNQDVRSANPQAVIP